MLIRWEADHLMGSFDHVHLVGRRIQNQAERPDDRL